MYYPVITGIKELILKLSDRLEIKINVVCAMLVNVIVKLNSNSYNCKVNSIEHQ